jgi:hypothetical protein
MGIIVLPDCPSVRVISGRLIQCLPENPPKDIKSLVTKNVGCHFCLGKIEKCDEVV